MTKQERLKMIEEIELKNKNDLDKILNSDSDDIEYLNRRLMETILVRKFIKTLKEIEETLED